MPVPGILPKGCSATRGTADVPHIATHGGLAQAANQLYMLSVRRVSLMNKKKATAARLQETTDQLRAIEVETEKLEKKYGTLKGNAKALGARFARRRSNGDGDDGPTKGRMTLKY